MLLRLPHRPGAPPRRRRRHGRRARARARAVSQLRHGRGRVLLVVVVAVVLARRLVRRGLVLVVMLVGVVHRCLRACLRGVWGGGGESVFLGAFARTKSGDVTFVFGRVCVCSNAHDQMHSTRCTSRCLDHGIRNVRRHRK